MINDSEVVFLLIAGPVLTLIIIGVWWLVGMSVYRRILLKNYASGKDMREFIPRQYDRWKWTSMQFFVWPIVLILGGNLLLQPQNSPLFVPVVVIWILLIFVAFSGFSGFNRLQRQKAITGFLDSCLESGAARELDEIGPGFLEIGEFRIRRHAMETLLAWGSPAAVTRLQNIRSGHHATMPPVFYSSLRRLVFDLHHAQADDLPSMLRLTRHTRFWRSLANEHASKTNPTRLKDMEEMAVDFAPLLDFYHENQARLESFPHVFSEKSRRRAVKKDLDYISVVQDPVEETHVGVVTGVKEVVGQIGGEGEGMQEAGKYVVQLWDGMEKRVAPAEIDSLEIHPQADDWGVVAVLEKMEEHFTKLRFRIEEIGAPELSENTRRIMEKHGA